MAERAREIVTRSPSGPCIATRSRAPLAFAAWLGVHAMLLLSGTHSKADAFLTWAWDYFDRDHAATVEASTVRGASPGATTTRTSRTSHSTGRSPPTPPQRHETARVAEHDVLIVLAAFTRRG